MLRHYLAHSAKQQIKVSLVSVLRKRCLSSSPETRNLDTISPADNRPPTASFFTGRSNYNDIINALQIVQKESKAALDSVYLLPVSPQRRRIIKDNQRGNPRLWMPIDKLSDAIGAQPAMRVSQYRDIMLRLSELEDYRVIALSGGQVAVVDRIESILKQFERPDMQAILAAKKKPVELTEFGGTYTVGRRKESHARVWLIPSKLKQPSRPKTLAPQSDSW